MHTQNGFEWWCVRTLHIFYLNMHKTATFFSDRNNLFFIKRRTDMNAARRQQYAKGQWIIKRWKCKKRSLFVIGKNNYNAYIFYKSSIYT